TAPRASASSPSIRTWEPSISSRSCTSIRAHAGLLVPRRSLWRTGPPTGLGLPVFLYGELTAGERHPARSRAQLRRGGVVALAQRMASGRGEQEGATTG